MAQGIVDELRQHNRDNSEIPRWLDDRACARTVRQLQQAVYEGKRTAQGLAQLSTQESQPSREIVLQRAQLEQEDAQDREISAGMARIRPRGPAVHELASSSARVGM